MKLTKRELRQIITEVLQENAYRRPGAGTRRLGSGIDPQVDPAKSESWALVSMLKDVGVDYTEVIDDTGEILLEEEWGGEGFVSVVEDIAGEFGINVKDLEITVINRSTYLDVVLDDGKYKIDMILDEIVDPDDLYAAWAEWTRRQ